MLTVVTPATSFRLTDIERARDFLRFPSSDDEAADACIDQASRAIADFCRRPFGRETVRETLRGSDVTGGALLSRSPVTAFVSVTADGSALLTSEYVFDPATGRLSWADAYGASGWWWGAGLVIEYTAGYVLPDDADPPTLPEPVERAAILLTGAYLSARSRDPLVKSEDVAGIGSTSWWMPGSSDALPAPEVESLLQPYRRLFP